ncbi:hypothetical protein C5H21_02835 [Xylella fastidiosa]|nr:hypothetical protein C5H21_02835 [Xylella fastidiosa]
MCGGSYYFLGLGLMRGFILFALLVFPLYAWGSLAVMVVLLVVGIILIKARLMKQPLKWLIFKIVL